MSSSLMWYRESFIFPKPWKSEGNSAKSGVSDVLDVCVVVSPSCRGPKHIASTFNDTRPNCTHASRLRSAYLCPFTTNIVSTCIRVSVHSNASNVPITFSMVFPGPTNFLLEQRSFQCAFPSGILIPPPLYQV